MTASRPGALDGWLPGGERDDLGGAPATTITKAAVDPRGTVTSVLVRTCAGHRTRVPVDAASVDRDGRVLRTVDAGQLDAASEVLAHIVRGEARRLRAHLGVR